jgi:hypothetical protein
MAKKHAISTLSPMTNEEAWAIVEPAIKQIEALLISMKGSIKAQVTRANTTLADLRHRVEILERRQGMGETKRGAKKGQAQSKRKEG